MKKPVSERIGVCSWSLQPTSAQDLICKLQQLEINAVQIALDPIREGHAGPWRDLPAHCQRSGIQLVSGMFTTVGEDYSTLESIRQTGGVVPDSTWDENWKRIQEDIDWAEELSLPLVTFHAGFIPENPRDPNYIKLIDRVRRIADLCGEEGIMLGLETGQEEAETLLEFLEALERPNVCVNFDPANMILYDKGDPVSAVRRLGSWIQQCHIKDANRTRIPGTWGEEVVVGSGQVQWEDFFKALDQIGFTGWFCIEREAGNQRVEDIRRAREFVINLANRLGL